MKQLDKDSLSLLKLNLEFVYLFVEVAKPYLKDNDYNFYKRTIRDIDLKRNCYNILHDSGIIVDEILKHCSF